LSTRHRGLARPDVTRRAKDLYLGPPQMTPTQVHRQLCDEMDEPPSLSAVKLWLMDLKRDDEEMWNLADRTNGPDADPAFVFRVLTKLIEKRADAFLNTREATTITRLYLVKDDLEPIEAYRMARELLRAEKLEAPADRFQVRKDVYGKLVETDERYALGVKSGYYSGATAGTAGRFTLDAYIARPSDGGAAVTEARS
jgi:hypothetical protein